MVREFLAVAVRAALQWALASLLLANGAAFCLIAAVSARFRLGPPCILCARVHRLLRSTDGRDDDALRLRLLLCDAHLAATCWPEEQACCAVTGRGSEESAEELDDVDGRRDKKGSGLDSHRAVSIGSEICEQEGHDDTNGSSDARRRRTDDGPLFELAPIPRDDDDGEQQPQPELLPLLRNVEGGERLTVGQLLSLRAERRELDALRAELDAERRARAAAEERRRELEAQVAVDREAARLAMMELVHDEAEREKKRVLQQQQLDDACSRAELHGGGGEEERGGGGADNEDNNYQSLVDFFPAGSAYSSSPDLTNLLKLYPEPAGNGDDPRQGGEGYTPAVTVVAEEVEEEEEVVTPRGH